MLDDLTGEQVAEWAAYNELEPIGEYRRDYMEAQIISTVHNIAQSVFSKKGRSKKATRPEDCIPWLDKPEGTGQSSSMQSPEDIKAVFMDLKKNTPQTRGKKQKLNTKTGETVKQHKQKGSEENG